MAEHLDQDEWDPLTAEQQGLPGALAFIDAYLRASEGAVASVETVTANDGTDMVLLRVEDAERGDTILALEAREARGFAELLEKWLCIHPLTRTTAGLPALILALRDGADKLDEIGRATKH